MIDLSRNRAQFLAEIEAAEPRGEPLSDPADPRIASGNAPLRVLGHSKKDLFPLLKLALLERFAQVPRTQLNRDLLIPLRNALGNAYKHGNAKNPAGNIFVEIVLGRRGALATVTDEGSGFDVAQTFLRFQRREDYCMNRGAGFRNLHEAKSTVSYENGGRTLLLCFRPVAPGDTRGDEDPRQGPNGSVGNLSPAAIARGNRGGRGLTRSATNAGFVGKFRDSPHGKSGPQLLDPEWIQACLSAELPEFGSGQARIESCRVYAIRGPADDGCGNRYVIRVARDGGQPAETRIFTGRLHATEAAAAADFEAAKCLHAAAVSKRLLVPRPVARLGAEPRLVLYDFDPWLSLEEYLSHRPGLKPLLHAAERAGKALADLHGSQVAVRSTETVPNARGRGSEVEAPASIGAEKFRALVARAEINLGILPGGSGLVNRLRVCVERTPERAALSRPRTVATIHGALDWGCIHFGGDGRFYLDRFEFCRQSDPGLDLGGFAADLLCFTLANHSREIYRNCLDAFLTKYNAEAKDPMGRDDLRFYTALALVEHLGRAECRKKAGAGQWLGALEAESGRWEAVATSEVPS